MTEIRPYRAADREALYAICLKTGDAGRDATALYADPELLGHVYAGAYAALDPDCCLVVEDDSGVGGYIVGTADTRAFEAACERDWWPALRARYADPPAGERTPDARMARLIHHPPRVPQHIADAWPAHLHINLLPRLQGQGWGRRLIETWRATLASRGAPACHLAVGLANPNAIAFYRTCGFRKLLRTDGPHGVIVFGMACAP